MWAKIQKNLHTYIIKCHVLQILTEEVIQLSDILINFAPKSIKIRSYVTTY